MVIVNNKEKQTVVKYQVRSKQTRWKATFRTLREARLHAKKDWGFVNDPTVYIVRITEKNFNV
ncbi:MAG: hypothetical protein EBT86_13345 [Actinobacteria bacterium]|nr:hypothetical protein [Actinomycetota bacterium]